jgi:hypothetical protein
MATFNPIHIALSLLIIIAAAAAVVWAVQKYRHQRRKP